MTSDSEPPWYRRPVPPWMPAWLVLSVCTAVAGGYLATRARECTARTVVIGCGAGFFAGLLFSMAMAARLGRAESPATSHFRPPVWLSVPASVALLLLIGFALIDETLRQGHYDGYGGRRLRYYQIPGPLAVGLACGCLTGAGVISIGGVWRRDRPASGLVGGLLGTAILLVGLCVIAARVWGHFAVPPAEVDRAGRTALRELKGGDAGPATKPGRSAAGGRTGGPSRGRAGWHEREGLDHHRPRVHGRQFGRSEGPPGPAAGRRGVGVGTVPAGAVGRIRPEATEVVVYFAIPGLREETFPFEIWADRFLGDRVLLSPPHRSNREFFEAAPDGFRSALLKKRWDIRHGPSPGDRIEGMIHGFVARNDAWDRIWAECFPEIDGHMEEFEARCPRNRTHAVRWHADWLLEKKGTGACPYQPQAAEYVRVAAAFKRQFASQTVEVAQRADGGMSTV